MNVSNDWLCHLLFTLVYFSFLPSLDFSLSIALPPHFSFFVCCFTRTRSYSFSFPNFFLCYLSCDLPYSWATFHAMEQRSYAVGCLMLATLQPRGSLHLQRSAFMPGLISDAGEASWPGILIHVCACRCVSVFKMSVSSIGSADWRLLQARQQLGEARAGLQSLGKD